MPNTDGSFGIKIIISSKGTATYIPTRFKVDNLNQWKNGRIVRRQDAEVNNRKLRELLQKYTDILDSMPDTNVPAVEIRRYIEKHLHRTDSLRDFARDCIDSLIKEKRTSYATNMSYTLKYLLDCLGDDFTLQQFKLDTLYKFEKYLREQGSSATTINIRMSHLKALLNVAVTKGKVEYSIFPFRGYKMPSKNIRDICISKQELCRLREAKFKGLSARRFTVARDLFMLSFYCAGINLTDLIDATLQGEYLTFIRKKTANKKLGSDIQVSMTIQPEAREIIDRYVTEDGRLDMGYNYTEYDQFRSFVTKSLNRIGEELGFEKRLMYYSARKTFVQYGSEIGVPLHILEYAIGQSIKEANKRPIFNYLKVMRQQADMAIRAIIDYSFEPDTEDNIPVPEWARRRRH